MNRKRTWPSIAALVLAVGGGGVGCDDKPQQGLAPAATALAVAKPAAALAKKFTIDKESTKLDFMMEAPKEKIRGRVDKATDGDLEIDLSDLTKTVGVIHADITGIEVYQTKSDEKGEFGKEEKSDLQNEHVRNWLQIGKDAPPDALKTNSRVEFSIKKIETGTSDVTKLTGDSRKVDLKATGDFLLHGRKVEKVVELEATFNFHDDHVTSIAVKSTKPFGVDLAEHDVKPRETFAKLAQKGLDILAPKVAKEALVSVAFTAKAASPN